MKREFYDFILGYEHRNREVPSLIVLKVSLESQGYRVMLYNIEDRPYDFEKRKYACHVFAMPYGYNDYRLYIAVKNKIRFEKLVNFQWEQVFNREMEEKRDSYKTPTGLFQKYGMHIAWGEANRRRLVQNADIDEMRVRVCGHMAMDFLREPLSELYLSRSELLHRYGLADDRKVYLFISSFKAAFLSEAALEKDCQLFGESRREQHELMLKSFWSCMDWWEEAMQMYPREQFVYRPHPGEQASWSQEIREKINRLAEKNSNFKIIDELPVQQWILAADVICCGLSTAVVEVYFAGKQCHILLPYDLPRQLQMSIFANARFLKERAEFMRVFEEQEQEFPVPGNDIEDYYQRANGPAWKNVEDTMLCVLNDGTERFFIPPEEREAVLKEGERKYWQGRKKIWKLRIVKKLQLFFGKWIYAPAFCRGAYLEQKSCREWEKREVLSEEEIQELTAKTAACLRLGVV